MEINKGTFEYVELDAETQAKQDAVREAYAAAEEAVLANLGYTCESELAHARLQESYIWVRKALRTEQLERQQASTDGRVDVIK